jgi:cysteine desulfurase
VHRLGVDLLTLGGSKIYGPKSSGLLYIKSQVQLKPIIFGGGQQKGLRAGTESLANIVGIATALAMVQSKRSQNHQRFEQLRSQFLVKLRSKKIKVQGSSKYRLPHIITLKVPVDDAERLVMELDERGFMVGTGAACEALSDKPSSALKAIGLSDVAANQTIRVSFGLDTTMSQVNRLAEALNDLVG